MRSVVGFSHLHCEQQFFFNEKHYIPVLRNHSGNWLQYIPYIYTKQTTKTLSVQCNTPSVNIVTDGVTQQRTPSANVVQRKKKQNFHNIKIVLFSPRFHFAKLKNKPLDGEKQIKGYIKEKGMQGILKKDTVHFLICCDFNERRWLRTQSCSGVVRILGFNFNFITYWQRISGIKNLFRCETSKRLHFHYFPVKSRTPVLPGLPPFQHLIVLTQQWESWSDLTFNIIFKNTVFPPVQNKSF